MVFPPEISRAMTRGQAIGSSLTNLVQRLKWNARRPMA